MAEIVNYVEKAYDELDNYETEDSGSSVSVSVIYFTSNALYFPDDNETARKRIFEDNRYEYRHYRRKRQAGENVREIFVRDVRKQWYITGISRKYGTVDETAELLKSLTRGTRIITVGTSACGFAACLFGEMLHASDISAFPDSLI